jgi:hypothetical protein
VQREVKTYSSEFGAVSIQTSRDVDPSRTPFIEMVAKDPRDVEIAANATKLVNAVMNPKDEYNRLMVEAMQESSARVFGKFSFV